MTVRIPKWRPKQGEQVYWRDPSGKRSGYATLIRTDGFTRGSSAVIMKDNEEIQVLFYELS